MSELEDEKRSHTDEDDRYEDDEDAFDRCTMQVVEGARKLVRINISNYRTSKMKRLCTPKM